MGPVTAHSLVKKYKSLDQVLLNLSEENSAGFSSPKFEIPSEYPFEEARRIFMSHQVEKDMTKLNVIMVSTFSKSLA